MCLAASVFFAGLFVVFLFAPQLVYWLLGILGGPDASFIARRAAMLFLGLGVLCWFARKACVSPARSAVCLGVASAMGGLAVLGLFELLREYAGFGILLAIAVELVVAVSFLRFAAIDSRSR